MKTLTGGTGPADEVHEEVVTAMAEVGINLAGREPREIKFEELRDNQCVVTLGCSTENVCPATWSGENRDW
ncbi:hypothetical protein [Haladaptatus pallidirubidus]|uniref:arsenate reductase/protein-tyrosine-phosphatase family protein n=1 Tax=Haladaptatus pallidirubidus TaxID=1008152 RepID=UPI003CD06AAC